MICRFLKSKTPFESIQFLLALVEAHRFTNLPTREVPRKWISDRNNCSDDSIIPDPSGAFVLYFGSAHYNTSDNKDFK